MIDLQTETVVTFKQATKDHIPPRNSGEPVHVASLYSWGTKGILGVKLEWTQMGATRVTSVEALQRFFDRIAAVERGEAQPIRTERQRDKSAADADSALVKAGW